MTHPIQDYPTLVIVISIDPDFERNLALQENVNWHPNQILSSIPSLDPRIDIACMCVCVHVVCAYIRLSINTLEAWMPLI